MKKTQLLLLALLVALLIGCTPTDSVVDSGNTEETRPLEVPQEDLIETVRVIGDLSPGDYVETRNARITVEDAKITDTYSYYDEIFEETRDEFAPLGKLFVVATIKIENVGSDDFYLGANDFSVRNSAGLRENSEFTFSTGEALDYVKQFYPGDKDSGMVVFEIPEDSEDVRIEIDLAGFFDGPELASWNIN